MVKVYIAIVPANNAAGLRAGLSRTAYSLPNSVNMLWDSGLHLLAVLVVAFSVRFPFAKLPVLGSVEACTPNCR
jgi:hypothetical protein